MVAAKANPPPALSAEDVARLAALASSAAPVARALMPRLGGTPHDWLNTGIGAACLYVLLRLAGVV